MYSDQEIKLCIAIDLIVMVRDALKEAKNLERAIALINSAIDDNLSYLDEETMKLYQDEMKEHESDYGEIEI